MPSLSEAVTRVATLLTGVSENARLDAAELSVPIRQAQIEVQRYLRVNGISDIKITVATSYASLATTIDNASGTIRPLEVWEKPEETSPDTEYARVLEAVDPQLDMLSPTQRLTLWSYDGGVVHVRPCVENRWIRMRGQMVSVEITLPWDAMTIGAALATDEFWYPVFNLAAADWLLSHDKRTLAGERTAIANRQLEAIRQEHARYKQSRPRRRRPYRS